MAFRPRNFFVFLLGIVLFSSSKGYAEIPTEWLRPQSDIADAWRIRKEVLAVGRDPLGKKELDRIKDIQNQYGLTSISSVAFSLLKEIEDHSDDSQDVQLERITYAKQFGPKIPTQHYLYCHRILNDGFFETFHECYKGLVEELSENSGQLLWATNFVLFALISLSLLSFLFFGLLCLRYRNPVSHHWAHWLKGLSPFGVQCLMLLLLFLSWISIGWIGPPLLLIVLLWRYWSRNEKWVAGFFLVLSALIPLALYAPAIHLNYKRSILPIIAEPLNGTSLVENATRLEEWIKLNPKDAEALFVLGLIEKKLGRYDSARNYFEEAAKSRSGWAKPNINLANIDLIEGKLDAAIGRLQTTNSTAPTFLAFFNVAKILYKQSRFEEGMTANRKAKELDPVRFATLEKVSSTQSDPKKFLDETLETDDLSSRIWARSPTVEEYRNRFHRTFFSVLPLPIYWLVLITVLLYALLSSRLWVVKRPPRPCEKCGMPSCAICEPMVEHESLCTQCYHLYVRLEAIDLDARRNKEKAIQLHRILREVRERWITILIPGLHLLYKDRAISWFFNLIFLVPGIVFIFYQKFWIFSGLSVATLPMFPIEWFGWSLLVIFYSGLTFVAVRK